jgi:hypothetical protein
MAREAAQTQLRESKKRCSKYKNIIKNGDFYKIIPNEAVQNKNRIRVSFPILDMEIEG